ncbi:class I SAM-dependent methyltransferase [Marivita sp. S6314]|uniref:class I SAM-dependent methyltransferase n=1 Tax=Marivita sp. S6314 TaxID=2926406 RepID=UPI001FF5E8AD|nr:class I SAM-dependent methyltransferase [Marivita sp. S6314]MCK0150626.1 class I SAM-dependent methyltransferase [Marivita sp. S6314]
MYQTASFWDGIAEKYAKTPIKDNQSYAYTLDRTRSYLRPEDRMLEIGCGTGSTALELAPQVAHIVATDISDAMLSKGRTKAAEQGIGNVEFAQADAEHAPSGPFDVVTAFNLLHLVEDIDATLAEIHQRVQPGGLFISKTFCMPDRFGLLTLMMHIGVPVMQFFGKAPYVAHLKASDLDAALVRAGFTIIEVGQGPTKDPRRYLVARREQ